MAIVQISRIQHRRGRAEGVGLPQLASGEIGWAIDTQELYIGNGSVSEGAPAVGNTQILTSTTNIFDLADQYSYKPTDNFWEGNPVTRSLQSKLDDVVSVFDFGASGDGSDQTTEIQSAIDKLFNSEEQTNNVILWFPAGTYTISSTLVLPPFATLRGAGKGKTILQTSNSDLFTTVHDADSVIDSNTQSRYLELSSMSLIVNSATNKALILRSVKNSIFRDLRIKGVFPEGTNPLTSEAAYGTHTAIELTAENGLIAPFNISSTVICQSNLFENIEIDNFYYGVYSDYDMMYNTFDNMNFYVSSMAIRFGKETAVPSVAMNTGPSYTTIKNSKFDRIERQGVYIQYGEYNVSRNNRYLNVGNFGGSDSADSVSIIVFDSPTNITENDYFKRTSQLTVNPSISYAPEVAGRTFYKNSYLNEIDIGNLPSNSEILQFPVAEGTIFIDYIYTDKSGAIVNVLKEGTLEIICAVDAASPEVIVNDDYNFIGDPSLISALSFDASYSVNESTVNLLASNTIAVDNDSFLYNIRVKSN